MGYPPGYTYVPTVKYQKKKTILEVSAWLDQVLSCPRSKFEKIAFFFFFCLKKEEKKATLLQY